MDSEQTLREILDAQLEMVCRMRGDTTLEYVNRSYAGLLHTVPQAIVGKRLLDLVPPHNKADIQVSLARLTPQNPIDAIESPLDGPGGQRWILWRNHGLAFDAEGKATLVQSGGVDITERKQLDDQLHLMIEELNHRVKNSLMVVQAMAWQSFRHAALPAGAMDAFTGRLHALAAAHNVLSRTGWAGAAITDSVQQGVSIAADEATRIAMAGPATRLTPAATVSLVLVLHELTTNALRHGSLSQPAGSVSVHWDVDAQGKLALTWLERGGPAMAVPGRAGFGSRLITDAVVRQLSGEVHVDHQAEGLWARLVVPAAHIIDHAARAAEEPA